MENIDQGRSYYNKNINISNCFFSRYLSYSGDGGIIYVSGGSYSMNVIYSMFYNCVCSSDGGAIHFSSSNSYLRMICANSCSASFCRFAYLYASRLNQVEYLSVSNCSHTTSGNNPIYIESGYQRIDNTNSSMNNVFRGLVLLSIIHPHSQAHTALSQTTRHLVAYAYTSFLPQEQYQCHMLTLFITTVHLWELCM